jgi:hexosaminidase
MIWLRFAFFFLLCCLRAAASDPLVFPVPQEMELKGASFALREPIHIVIPASPSGNDLLLARELAADLGDLHALNVSIEKSPRLPASGRFILMGAVTNPLVKQYCAQHGLTVTQSSPGKEGYVLQANGDVVIVAGSDERGAFYGLQSLRQLIARTPGGPNIPGVLIKDWPHQPFRGVKLYLPGRDNIPFFKRFVRDFMALYKYNQLIVEINGALRLDRHPEINAGWIDLFKDLSYSRRDRSAGPHGEYQDSPNQDVADGGVLEKDEVADLVQWARRYYIDFIPEVPSLTHSNYLLTRHRELADVPDAEWPDAYCPSNPASYKLLFDVLDEVIDVVKPRMVHIGHDEWRAPLGACPRCGDKDRAELFAQDVNKIHAYLAARGIRTAMYGDHLVERVRGKGSTAQKTRAGYAYQWPGALTPELVKQKIPKDILLFNWFWRDGKQGSGEDNDIQLADWGFQQVYMNFDPSIENYARRSGRASVLGGVPASWAATTEFNFGKDLMSDFLGCANIMWSKHLYEPKDLTPIVQTRIPDVRRRLSGIEPPSSAGDLVTVKFDPGAAATGIAIGEDASSLVFLHASEKPAANELSYRYIYNFVDTAELLGQYEVLYDDGFVATVSIRYGVNILERTWAATGKPGTYCYGADPVPTADGTFFAYEWINPRFGKVIRQVTLKLSEGKRTTSNPVLLKEIHLVRKRSFPDPVKARTYESDVKN